MLLPAVDACIFGLWGKRLNLNWPRQKRYLREQRKGLQAWLDLGIPIMFLSIAWIFSWGIITGSSGPALPTYAWLFSVTQIPRLSLDGLVVSRCLSGTNHWRLEWPGLGHTPALVWRDGLGPLRVEERQFPKRERGPDVQTASYSWLKGIQLLCVRVMPLRVGRSRRCHEYSPKELGDQLVDRDTFVK